MLMNRKFSGIIEDMVLFRRKASSDKEVCQLLLSVSFEIDSPSVDSPSMEITYMPEAQAFIPMKYEELAPGMRVIVTGYFMANRFMALTLYKAH